MKFNKIKDIENRVPKKGSFKHMLRRMDEQGRIVKGVNTTVDVDTNEIPKQASKFGNTVDVDGRPPTLSKKVKGSSTNVLDNLGLAEGKAIPNPKNSFAAGADSAYDFYKLGVNMANLKSMPDDSNVGEPDIMVSPYAGEKEMKYLMRQLKRLGYTVDDVEGYQDTHIADEGIEPPQIKNEGRLGKIKLKKLRPVQKTRKFKKLFNQIFRVAEDNYAPITIDKHGNIINGHHRYDALRLFDSEYAIVRMIDSTLDEVMSENFADGKKKGLIKATKEDFLAFKKFVKGTTHLFKNYNNMSEEEQDELLADLVKLQFDSNLMNSFPKWKEYAIKNMKDMDDERMYKVFKQAGLVENFADGKKKGKSRPGRVKRAGASCDGSVTSLRKKAKNASGERAKMYHWCANMKSGRKKKS